MTRTQWLKAQEKEKEKDEEYAFEKCLAMRDKEDTYLPAFEGNAQYDRLAREFSQLRKFLLQYWGATIDSTYALMGAQVQPRKPVSPTTAAAVGTAIGGVGVGYAAALNATQKENAYRENQQKIVSTSASMAGSLAAAKATCDDIITIIETNPTTRKDWQEEDRKIKAKVDKKFDIR